MRRLRTALLVVASTLATVASSPLLAQQGGTRLPPGAAAAIDSLFVPMSHAGAPGCAVGVYQNGAITFARGYGFNACGSK